MALGASCAGYKAGDYGDWGTAVQEGRWTLLNDDITYAHCRPVKTGHPSRAQGAGHEYWFGNCAETIPFMELQGKSLKTFPSCYGMKSQQCLLETKHREHVASVHGITLNPHRVESPSAKDNFEAERKTSLSMRAIPLYELRGIHKHFASRIQSVVQSGYTSSQRNKISSRIIESLICLADLWAPICLQKSPFPQQGSNLATRCLDDMLILSPPGEKATVSGMETVQRQFLS